MCSESLNDSSTEPSSKVGFEQLKGIVESEFTVEEGLIEYNVPTFYVRLSQDSKKAFLRLVKRLDAFESIPVLRDKEGRVVLQVVRKPLVKSSRKIINLVLFLATIGTTLVTGYFLSLDLLNPLEGAGMFTVALLAILGSHEMGHKLAAKTHGIESTMPYFIPGPPWPFGIGTFGAVIQQKSLAPNRDALFDLGASGPIIGFVFSVVMTAIGLQMSLVHHSAEILPSLPVPILFDFLAGAIVHLPPPPPGEPYTYIMLHPVAFAGWVGMLVTTLNLVPIGMFDGGHAVRSLLGQKARAALSFISIMILLLLGQFIMAILAFLLSRYKHPGPLDDVSKLTLGRKLAAIALVLIFALCVTSFWFFY